MKKSITTIIYIFIFFFSTSSFGATITWRGAGVSGGTGNTNFNLASNWTGGFVPGPSDDAVMILNSNTSTYVQLNADITVNSLSITMAYTTTNRSRTFYFYTDDYVLTVNNDFLVKNSSIYNSSRTQSLYILPGGTTASTGKVKVYGTATFDDGTSTYMVWLGQRYNNTSVLPWEFYGDVNFGANGSFIYTFQPTAVIFDATTSQTVTVNNNPWFPSIYIGYNNTPYVTFANVSGNNTIWLRENLYYTDVIIFEGATMDLTEGIGIASHGTYSGGSNFGDYFHLAGTIILRDISGGLYGSNFPYGFGANTNNPPRGGYIVYTGCTEIYEATNGAQSKYLIGYSNNLVINNTYGVTLGGELTVNETLNLQSGEFINRTAINNSISVFCSEGKEKLKRAVTPINRSSNTEEIEMLTAHGFKKKQIVLNPLIGESRANYLTMADSSAIIRTGGYLSSIVPSFGGIVDIIYNQHTSNILSGVEIPSSTTTLRNLTINNSNGVTLNSNTFVYGQLNLTSGVLTTETNTISFEISAADPSESLSSYILGNSVMLSRNVGTGSLDFLGVNLQEGSDLGNITLIRTTGSPYTYGGNYSINCNWDINPSINPPASPRFVNYTWLSVFDGLVNFTSLNNAKVYRSTDNGLTWSGIGDSADISLLNPRTIQNVSANHFSVWTISGIQGPLPVKLLSFSSAVIGRDVKLNWVTEMEENNSGFEVQKSEVNSIKNEELRIKNNENGDGLKWMNIGFVQGKGTKNSQTNYNFEDKNVQTGKYKYRLKQIDYNGNFEYFELTGQVEVGVPAKYYMSQNYPNPFNPVTKINFDIPESGLVSLKVYDVLGKEVATIFNEMKDAGFYTISFDAAGLSSGVYFYRLSLNGFSSIKRLVVLK